MIKKKSTQGFTLTELLIALFVFSLLTAFAFRSVNVLWSSAGSLQVEGVELQDVQKTLNILERDVRRAVNLELKTVSAAGLQSNEVNSAWLIVTSLDERSKRVGRNSYYFKDEKLISETYIADESGEADASDSLVLLSDIVSFEVDLQNSGSAPPDAVRLALSHKALGVISRDYYVGMGTADADLNLLDLEAIGTSAGGSVGESVGATSSQATQPAQPVSDPLEGQAVW